MSSESVAAVCGFIIGILFGVYIGATFFQEAEATHYDKCMGYVCGVEALLYHILVEEQKQTELLDQIDCYSAYEWKEGWYPNQLVNKFRMCGEPLNYTGVWTP